jgi:hypothetical protein
MTALNYLQKPKTQLFLKSNQKKPAKVISLPGLDNAVLQVDTDLGVDNIKAAFEIILEIGEDFVGLAQNFSIQAAVPIAFKLARIQTYIEIFKGALEEFRVGISTDEAAEIASDLKINFDIENNNLEETIERIIDLMPSTYVYLYDTVTNGISLYGGWSATVVELKTLMKKD